MGWLYLLISIVFALLSWATPVAARWKGMRGHYVSLVSLGLCGLSLATQVFHAAYLVAETEWGVLQDWTRMAPTQAAICLIGALLVNGVLNAIAFIDNKRGN